MRSVICHFFNEAYLLPWWLKHHSKLFDFGIMIDHGSTDDSGDIIREAVPHWRLVRSQLNHFDPYLTDFEVMTYEKDLLGWKIALNVTEFLMPAMSLSYIESSLEASGREGCSASGILVIDNHPEIEPKRIRSLPEQKHWGIDDNEILEFNERVSLGLPASPYRNRFFHRCATGMYHPGRHQSFHPDSHFRVLELMVFHFGYAPWNVHMIKRKTQILDKLSTRELRFGWGVHHVKNEAEINRDFEIIRANAVDLKLHPHAKKAIALASVIYE